MSMHANLVAEAHLAEGLVVHVMATMEKSIKL